MTNHGKIKTKKEFMEAKVAIDFLEELQRGKKPSLPNIMRAHGYSENQVVKSHKVSQSPVFERITLPFFEKLVRHRDKMIKELESRDLKDLDFRVLSEALDRVQKNILILEGKSTQNVGITVQTISYDQLPKVESRPAEDALYIEGGPVEESISDNE